MKLKNLMFLPLLLSQLTIAGTVKGKFEEYANSDRDAVYEFLDITSLAANGGYAGMAVVPIDLSSVTTSVNTGSALGAFLSTSVYSCFVEFGNEAEDSDWRGELFNNLSDCVVNNPLKITTLPVDMIVEELELSTDISSKESEEELISEALRVETMTQLAAVHAGNTQEGVIANILINNYIGNNQGVLSRSEAALEVMRKL